MKRPFRPVPGRWPRKGRTSRENQVSHESGRSGTLAADVKPNPVVSDRDAELHERLPSWPCRWPRPALPIASSPDRLTPMSDPSPSIIEATPETFQRDVIDRSHEVPVLVDFWAAWCQPCRLLGPVLERLANEYEGKFLLAKADTERLPEIAASFGVRSIPAVYGLRDGQVVDGFVGVQPEAEIRSFINRLLPSPTE